MSGFSKAKLCAVIMPCSNYLQMIITALQKVLPFVCLASTINRFELNKERCDSYQAKVNLFVRGAKGSPSSCCKKLAELCCGSILLGTLGCHSITAPFIAM